MFGVDLEPDVDLASLFHFY